MIAVAGADSTNRLFLAVCGEDAGAGGRGIGGTVAGGGRMIIATLSKEKVIIEGNR